MVNSKLVNRRKLEWTWYDFLYRILNGGNSDKITRTNNEYFAHGINFVLFDLIPITHSVIITRGLLYNLYRSLLQEVVNHNRGHNTEIDIDCIISAHVRSTRNQVDGKFRLSRKLPEGENAPVPFRMFGFIVLPSADVEKDSSKMFPPKKRSGSRQ